MSQDHPQLHPSPETECDTVPPGIHPTEPNEEHPTDEVTQSSHFLRRGLENDLPLCTLSLPVHGLGRHLVTASRKGLSSLLTPSPSPHWPAWVLETEGNQDPKVPNSPKHRTNHLPSPPPGLLLCGLGPEHLLGENVTCILAS